MFAEQAPYSWADSLEREISATSLSSDGRIYVIPTIYKYIIDIQTGNCYHKGSDAVELQKNLQES